VLWKCHQKFLVLKQLFHIFFALHNFFSWCFNTRIINI
jgi:hypothetical protein